MHREIRVHRSGCLHFDRWHHLDDIGYYLKSTIICLWSILVIRPEKISSMRFSTCRLQRRSHNEESSWRCDCSCRLHRGHGEQVRLKTGPSSSSSSDDLGNQDLFRQYHRDKEMPEDDEPFPANQREIRGEERTPPSTSAPAVMRFPCLCWLVALWRYLYPFWQKAETHRLILRPGMEKTNSESFISHVCLSSPWFWVNFLSLGDARLVYGWCSNGCQSMDYCNHLVSFHIVLPTFLYNTIH